MIVVADANILFSFFRKDSLVREIVVNPDLTYDLELVAPEKVFLELDKHKEEICKKAGITKEEFEFPRIWSYDRNLRKQSIIKILSTKELLKELSRPHH